MNEPVPTPSTPAPGVPPLAVEALAFSSLKAERIQLALLELPGWFLAEDAGSISRTFEPRTREAALALTCLICEICRAEGHEAALHLTGNRLVVVVSTPEAKGLTEADLELARRIAFQK